MNNQKNHPSLSSQIIKAHSLPWQETKFSGVYTKTLFFDHATGQLTALVKMDPGAHLPDHEHPLIEQTYVLEGYLEDLEGIDQGLRVGPDEFVWRPATSRHAVHTRDGCIMLAMFLIPNKFFEPTGDVLDMAGAIWDNTWGHILAKNIS